MNRFYMCSLELSPYKLASMANAAIGDKGNKSFTPWDFDPKNPEAKIYRENLCFCSDGGEFVYQMDMDGKCYFRCKRCGGPMNL